MNNSKLAIDSISLQVEEKVDISPKLQEKKSDLVKIITAIQELQKSKEWSTLKTHVFDGLVEALSVQLSAEAKKPSPDTQQLARLAGQLKWAEMYSDLSKLENFFRLQLTNVNQQLHG